MASCVEIAQQYPTQLHRGKVLKAEKGEISMLGKDLWCVDWGVFCCVGKNLKNPTIFMPLEDN